MNYCVKDLDGNVLQGDDLNSFFAKREEAKKLRATKRAAGVPCVVSRSVHHPHGETFPQPTCLNTEKTSKRRKKVEHGSDPVAV
jgi:hypothetical protein